MLQPKSCAVQIKRIQLRIGMGYNVKDDEPPIYTLYSGNISTT